MKIKEESAKFLKENVESVNEMLGRSEKTLNEIR